MSVAYPMLFKEKVLPVMEQHFKQPVTSAYLPAEDRTMWFFRGRLVALSEGENLGVGLVWIDDGKIPTDMALNIASWQHYAHNEMILRERQAAERIARKMGIK